MFKFRLFLSLILLSSFVVGGTIRGRVQVQFDDDNSGAIIYIDKIPGKTFAPPKEHARINQKNFLFIPKVLPILAGTIVDFLNSDNVLHNVFSPDAPDGKFNLGTWPRGYVRSDTFNTPGVATILCNVHPEMEAYVLSLESPYYATSDSLGNYTIQGVPAGDYKLSAWYFSADVQNHSIAVPKKGDINIDFIFK